MSWQTENGKTTGKDGLVGKKWFMVGVGWCLISCSVVYANTMRRLLFPSSRVQTCLLLVCESGRDAVIFFVIVDSRVFCSRHDRQPSRDEGPLEVGSSYITGSMPLVPRKGCRGLYPELWEADLAFGVSCGFVGLHEERMSAFAGARFWLLRLQRRCPGSGRLHPGGRPPRARA